MLIRSLVIVAVCALGIGAAEAQGIRGSEYRSGARCGVFQRIAVTSPPGTCVGLVAGPSDGLRLPRALLAVAPGRFIVSDLGAWSPGRGRLLDLRVAADGTPTVTALFTGLDLPHGLALGPDGKVYVGEAGKIWRFDAAAAKPVAEMVRDRLPTAGLHALKTFAFTPDGSLIVNHGSRTDRCETPGTQTPQVPCAETEGAAPDAALWKATFDRPGGRVTDYKLLARGLRNSVALAVHPRSGLVLQAENGLDLREDSVPPEELNVITAGGHYGWPYCTGRAFRTPGSKGGKPCSAYRAPAVTMPAHAAPLGLLNYQGAMFPQWRNRWLVSWHGYRQDRQRIVSYAARRDGRPIAPRGEPELIVGGWEAEPGVRPRGAPVGMAVAADGSLWIAEDKNRTILVVLKLGK